MEPFEALWVCLDCTYDLDQIKGYTHYDSKLQHMTGPAKTGNSCGHKLHPVTYLTSHLSILEQNIDFEFCNLYSSLNVY